MKSSTTRKKATTARTKPAAARAKAKRTSTRKPTGLSAAELIQTADQLGLRLYAIEGLTNFKRRAMETIERVRAAGMSYDKMTDSDWILMLQFIRDKTGGDQAFGRICQRLNIGPNEAFAGINSFVHEIAWQDGTLLQLSAAIDAKHREYGAKEDETWAEGEAPDDVEELRAAFDRRYLQLKVAILRHHGENEMAALLEADPDAYEARVEAGKGLFNEKRADKKD